MLATGERVVGADLEGLLPSSRSERSLVVSYFRLEGPDGRVLGAASIVSDVSERHLTRRALERANARLELLDRAGEVLNASLDLEQTLAGLGRLMVPEVADHCVVDLVDDTLPAAVPGPVVLRRHASVHAAGVELPPPDDAAQPWAPPGAVVTYPAGHPVATALARDEATLVHIDPASFDYDAVAPNETSAATARSLRIRSAIAIPLRARGRAVGVLSLVHSVSGRSHGDDEVLLARQLGDRAAVAIDNARLHQRERERALTLQRSLLPRGLPAVGGLETAARYLPARGGGGVGARSAATGTTSSPCPGAGGGGRRRRDGPRPRGRRADGSAARGGPGLRQPGPATVGRADSADELVRGLSDDVIVTCVYAVVDPRDGSVVVANAGHVPPLLLGGDPPDGVPRGRAVDATGAPLGAGGAEPYGERHLRLEQGQVLALYTDGLVERRDADLEVGLAGLIAAVDPLAPDLDAVCERVTAGVDRDDDVAVLMVRPDPGSRPPSVRHVFAADPRAVAAARRSPATCSCTCGASRRPWPTSPSSS